jgi:hypothetical protein
VAGKMVLFKFGSIWQFKNFEKKLFLLTKYKSYFFKELNSKESITVKFNLQNP